MDDQAQGPGDFADLPRVPPEFENEAATGGLAWLSEGARVLAFRRPRWGRLDAGPATVAVLVGAGYLLNFAVQRALMSGEPMFLWRGFLGGWVGVALSAWLCWVVVRSRTPEQGTTKATTTLFALCCAAGLVQVLLVSGALLGARGALGPAEDWAPGLQWAAWGLQLSWAGLSQLVLLWREAGSRVARGAALLLVPAALSLNGWPRRRSGGLRRRPAPRRRPKMPVLLPMPGCRSPTTPSPNRPGCSTRPCRA
jgi:hypothetical protein